MTYKLKVNDRQYEKWSVYHSSSLTLADISLNPIQHKLFDLGPERLRLWRSLKIFLAWMGIKLS